jgi:two-component system sensor histidine kinase AlgZ
MRFGDRLRVDWLWPDWADAVSLPPLLLQPLVENAMKHGISPSAEGGTVVISCARDGRGLLLRVANTGKPLAPGSAGIGLGNLRARLQLWTEVDATFTLESRAEWTEATLRWNEVPA